MSEGTDLTPEQERRLSEGVQLQFAAEKLFKTLTSLGVSPPIALGALAACAGEFIFKMHSDPQRRPHNRLAFESAVRNTVDALERVEDQGVQGATSGLAELQRREASSSSAVRQGEAGDEPKTNVVPLKPDPRNFREPRVPGGDYPKKGK